MDKKKIAAAVIGGLIVGGLGGVALDKEPTCDYTQLQEKIASLKGDLAQLNASYSELVLTNEQLQNELLKYDEVIKEAKAEEDAEVLALNEMLDSTRDFEDFLEDELGWEIEDDDDIEISDYDNVKTIYDNYDDEEYTFKFHDVLVKYSDDDNEYDERLDIYVTVEEGEVTEISFEVA